jgi:enamine deaminase RidA (YjgF/YER057c/UK114 family)
MDFLTVRKDAARSQTTSDVVRIGDWAFVAGQLPVDLDDDRVVLPEMVEAQTLKVLNNAETLLKKVEMTRDNVVCVRIYLVQFPKFYERVNDAYGSFFNPGRLPSRTCVGVTHLPRGALVEMDFVACRATEV